MKNNDYNINDEPNLPLDNNDKSSFGLPSDYFSSFEDKLRKKIEWQDELSDYPSLSSVTKSNVFYVVFYPIKNAFNFVFIIGLVCSYFKRYGF